MHQPANNPRRPPNAESPLKNLSLAGLDLACVPDYCWRGNATDPRLVVVTDAPTGYEINARFAFASEAGRLAEMVLYEAGVKTGDFLKFHDSLRRDERSDIDALRSITDPGEVFFYHLNTDARQDPSGKILPATEIETFFHAARFHKLVTLLRPEHVLMLGNGTVGPLLGRVSAGATAGATLSYIFPSILRQAIDVGNLDPDLAALSREVPPAVVSTDLHPAMLLQTPREKPNWAERIKKFAKALGKKIEVVEAEWTLFNESFERARNFLTSWIDDPTLTELSYDWETTDLDPCLHRETITLSIGVARDPRHGYCIPTWHRVGCLYSDPERRVLCDLIGRLLRKKRAVTLGHNLLFDNLVSRKDPHLRLGREPLPGLRQETMYLAYVNDEQGPQGLKELCNLYTDLHCYDDDLEDYKKVHKLKGTDYGKIPLSILGPYNAYDAIANFRVRDALIAKLKADRRGPFVAIALELMALQGQALEEIAFNGQAVDREICFREGRAHEAHLREAMMKLMAAPAIKDFIAFKRGVIAAKETRELLLQPLNLTRAFLTAHPSENPQAIRARIARFVKLLKAKTATLTETGEVRLADGTAYEDAEWVKRVYNLIYEDRFKKLDPANDDLEKWKPWLRDEEYQADEEELLYDSANAGTGYKPNFNTHGGGEMGEFFFKHLKLPVNFRSEKTGAPSLSKEARPQLIGLHPILTDFFAYKDTVKEYSVYFKPLIKAFRQLDHKHDSAELDPHGISHLEIEMGRTVTGRTRAQRLQTFPRQGKVKNMYVSRFKPGGLIVQADMSQAELRVVASLANEKKMIAAYLAGEDLHKTTSVLLFGDRFTKCTETKIKREMRALAKRFNFGIIYGSGGAGLVAVCKKEGAELLVAGGLAPADVYAVAAEELKLDLKDPYAYAAIEEMVDGWRTKIAEEFLARFYVAYPDLDRWTKRVHAFVQKHGYYASPFGRIRRLSAAINSPEPGDQNEAKRQAQNFPVQSAASDIAIVALAAIHADFRRRALASVSFAAVHDSLLFDCPLGETREVADLVKERLSSVKENFREFLPGFDTDWIKVPFETDVEVGPSWGVSFPYRDGKLLVESVETGFEKDLYLEIGDFWEWYGSREKK